MKRFLVIVWFILGMTVAYGQIRLDGTNRENAWQAVVPPYFPYLALDKNLSTCVAVNTNYTTPDVPPYFRIVFREPFFIDTIVIYNGYQKNTNVYLANNRVKNIGITGAFYVEKEGENEDEYVIKEEVFPLKDEWGPQEIKLGRAVKIQWLFFEVLSTYPGTRYDDTCISEIEFFYQGKKYDVVVLEEDKKNFLEVYKDRFLARIPAYVPHFISYDPSSRFAGSLKKMGITHDVDIIEFDRRDGGIYVYRKTRKDYSGEDFTIRDPKTGRVKMNRAVANRIGDWKLSEFSELMVKPLGGKQWEKTTDFRHFSGTFLEGIEYDEEDGMDEILEMGHPGH
ncbi:NADase-type glycan-binding domain-containing protein [Thermospira aquatica]|uniref:NAD glycohydrolase translocation F5/8 type C domain-containing protein n=1 Tax=Thermospira aquatica TaxID=2828656 RepID=A0AAX3BET0_9SPIR|nr:hypothetical protein [Thermospira aquatica]URA10628.1 hypothetical protein KDW03_02145 [Thermospira aquatica]